MSLLEHDRGFRLYGDDGLQTATDETGRIVAIDGRAWLDEDRSAPVRPAFDIAERFLQLYRKQGDEALANLRGAFRIVIWDRAAGRLLAAIDRAAVSQLYWAKGRDGAFHLSNSVELLCSSPTIDVRLSPESFYNFLYFYTIPAPGSIYRGVRKMRPGQLLTLTDGNVRPSYYWSMPYEEKTTEAVPDLRHRLRDKLNAAVQRSIVGVRSDRIGNFLSGGLDSSSITGMVAEQIPGVNSFTIRFEESAYDEGDFARLAADRFGTSHHERIVRPSDVVDVVEKIAGFYEEPYGNSSAVAAYFCALAAREAGIETMIAGDGGDELFAGNERYLYMRRFDIYGRIPRLIRRSISDPLLSIPAWDRVPVGRRARRLKQHYYLAIPERLYADYHPFMNFRRVDVFTPDFYAEIRDHDPIDLARTAYERAETGDVTQRTMGLDLQLTIADNDLVKVNGMCTLAGVDVRYPMLDDELLFFAAGIPGDILMPDSRLRGLFKDAMRGFLPDAIINKRKHGFGLPFKIWVSEDKRLHDCIMDSLSNMRGRGLLTDTYIFALQAACKSDGDGTMRGNAWDVAMLNFWLEHHRVDI